MFWRLLDYAVAIDQDEVDRLAEQWAKEDRLAGRRAVRVPALSEAVERAQRLRDQEGA
jgi:hypothetical protein